MAAFNAGRLLKKELDPGIHSKGVGLKIWIRNRIFGPVNSPI
jgi:hypothetical protein